MKKIILILCIVLNGYSAGPDNLNLSADKGNGGIVSDSDLQATELALELTSNKIFAFFNKNQQVWGLFSEVDMNQYFNLRKKLQFLVVEEEVYDDLGVERDCVNYPEGEKLVIKCTYQDIKEIEKEPEDYFVFVFHEQISLILAEKTTEDKRVGYEVSKRLGQFVKKVTQYDLEFKAASFKGKTIEHETCQVRSITSTGYVGGVYIDEIESELIQKGYQISKVNGSWLGSRDYNSKYGIYLSLGMSMLMDPGPGHLRHELARSSTELVMWNRNHYESTDDLLYVKEKAKRNIFIKNSDEGEKEAYANAAYWAMKQIPRCIKTKKLGFTNTQIEASKLVLDKTMYKDKVNLLRSETYYKIDLPDGSHYSACQDYSGDEISTCYEKLKWKLKEAKRLGQKVILVPSRLRKGNLIVVDY